MDTFYSNGKLLITAEYLVLNGAEALALPTKFGQSLTVEPNPEPVLNWQSYDENQALWFEATLFYKNTTLYSEIKNDFTNRLISILQAAKSLNPSFLKNQTGYSVNTYLDFPTNWGLGTSSTLINNIANWAKINPYKLLNLTFGGSGYDIACASNNTPITYVLNDAIPVIKRIAFNPKFTKHIYFVHLNQKQNSREGIAHYKSNTSDKSESIKAINTITTELISCNDLNQFNQLIEAHERIISNIIHLETVKDSLFPDFNGSIKSLGAWGGDFIMATSAENPENYFHKRGYYTVLSYQDMIL